MTSMTRCPPLPGRLPASPAGARRKGEGLRITHVVPASQVTATGADSAVRA
jgi:hypothetical protein